MKDNKLGIMPISKLIWNMSLPIIVSMLVQALYNIVDSVFVSQVSEQALTAVTLAFPAQNLMIGLATGTAVGVNALLGRALGAGDGKRADQVAINGIFLAVVGFVLSAVLALCFAGTFFRTQTDIDYIVDNGITYLRICCCASLGMFCEIMFERLLQGTGRSILSMYTQGLGAIVNIVLDPIFIFVFKMGVVGAAVATVIGQFCGCGLALYMNLRKNHDLHLRFRGFRPDWKIVGNIYAIGLPSVVMVAIGSVMTFCMNKILITYHSAKETAATAFGIYFKLNSFVFMPVFGLNNGVVPIVAYNYGAQNRRRMMETIKRSAIYASCIMVLGMAIFWAIPGTLVSIFNATETMKQVAVPALRIISLSFCTAGACIALGSSFQALGKSVYSMITSIIRQLVFLVPIAYVLARYGQSIGNDDLVWWCYPIAEIASLGVTMLFFLRVYRTVIAKVPLDGAPSLQAHSACRSFLPHPSADEVRLMTTLRGREVVPGLPACLNAVQQPRHAAAQIPHGLESLTVQHHILGTVAVDHVPVGGAHRHHVGDAEVLAQSVQTGGGACPPGGGHRSAGLSGKGAASGVEYPVQEGQHPPAGVGVIDRCAEYEAVGLPGLGDEVVDAAVGEHAAVLAALVAADAVPDGVAAQLHDLVVDARRGQGLAHLRQGGVGAALGVAAAVEHENLHGMIPP